MRMLATTLAVGLVACCTSSPRPMHDVDPSPGTSGRAPAPSPTDAKEPTVSSVTFTFVSRRRDHPPLSTLFVDVSLRNQGPRARWFLFPASVGKGDPPIASTTFGASVWSFPGTGNVVVAEFNGATSFYAIQLPPGAEVELRAVKIGLTGEPEADPLPLEVITADGFTVGGEAPAAWTKTPATCEPRADATQKDAKKLHAHRTADLGAVPVEVQGAERLDAALDLTP